MIFQLIMAALQEMFFQNSESRSLIVGYQIRVINRLMIMKWRLITSIRKLKSTYDTMEYGFQSNNL